MRQAPRPASRDADGCTNLRIAVLSPFVDRRHGTERALAELLDRLVRTHGCEVHLYAQRVEDLAVLSPVKDTHAPAPAIFWHRVRSLPGPHLLQFLFWMAANAISRMWDRWFHGLQFDAVFSPGINAMDADLVLVHAVFHRLKELQDASTVRGLRGLHRAAYYRLLSALENREYRRKGLRLAAVSRRTADQLSRYFGRDDAVVIPNGVDLAHFSPSACNEWRAPTRKKLSCGPEDRLLLLVGNDLRNKGLPALLQALEQCRDLPWRLCLLGGDAASEFSGEIRQRQLQDRIIFAGETGDILSYYAAADIYVASSVEDSFNLPALEAMACGLPVILSSSAGMSEYLEDGADGLLLRNPKDADELATALRRLLADRELCVQLGTNAVQTAMRFSWDQHAETIYQLLCTIASDSSPSPS